MKAIIIDSEYQKLVSYVKEKDIGSVFLSDEIQFYDRAVLRVYLSRLVEEGQICRLANGIFYIPRYSEVLKSYVIPDVDDIAFAIARSEKARIIPVGSYSIFKMGLSTQVPTVAVFGTDGAARVVNLNDGRKIKFKSIAAKNFAYKNPIMQNIVSAMREIGAKHLTHNHISRIVEIVGLVDYSDFEEDLRLAPEWIANLLRRERGHAN